MEVEDSRASAGRAGAGDREKALGEADLPLAAAGSACLGRCAWLLAGPAARVAGLVARDLQLGFEPLRGLFERDLEPVLEVVAAARARAARSAASSSEISRS